MMDKRRKGERQEADTNIGGG